LTRRTAIKWLHWICAFIILWFYLVEPEETRADPGGALSVHAGMGVILGVAALIWFSMFLLKGAAGRPGPKLQNLPRKAHPWLNKSLYYGVPALVLSGAFAGLAAPFVIYAFDVLPINFAGGSHGLHDLAEEVHEIVFNAVITLVVLHVAYHIWRHFRLKDNALRIMAPKIFHKWL
jgi:cytochrome b561